MTEQDKESTGLEKTLEEIEAKRFVAQCKINEVETAIVEKFGRYPKSELDLVKFIAKVVGHLK